MPHAGSEEIDPRGVPLIGHWIDSLADASHKERGAAAKVIGKSSDPDVDALLATSAGALALSQALGDRPATDPAVQRVAAHAYKSEKPEIRDLFTRFMPSDQRIKTLGNNFRSDRVLTLDGDAQRGHAIFATLNDGLCAKCHRVGSEGANFGPELTHIGSKYDRAQLLENIVEPSKTIAQGFAASFVKVKHGEPQIGLLVSRNDTELVLRTGPGVDVKIPAADIERVTTQTQSLMPEGLLSGLTAQQAADLLEYLQSLK
jgi:putative heme-binding domain-containing protein